MNPDMAMMYLDFVRNRHAIWESRQAGLPQPWTDDPILASRKFTNTFRLLDVGTQFLLSMLTEDLSPRETLARAFLYRHTGRPEPWEFFELMHGRYPLVDDLPLALETWKQYRGKVTTRLKNVKPYAERANRAGDFQSTTGERPIFTGAYLVFPQSTVPGTDKLESIVALVKRLFTPGAPQDVMPNFLSATNQQQRFTALRRNKGVADFMSMQVLTDYGYTTEDRENEFILAGPGAVKGAALVWPDKPAGYAISWAREQLGHIRLGDRAPSLADCQNGFCEVFKYHRWITKPEATKPYRPAHPGPQPPPILPRNW